MEVFLQFLHQWKTNRVTRSATRRTFSIWLMLTLTKLITGFSDSQSHETSRCASDSARDTLFAVQETRQITVHYSAVAVLVKGLKGNNHIYSFYWTWIIYHQLCIIIISEHALPSEFMSHVCGLTSFTVSKAVNEREKWSINVMDVWLLC